MSSEIIPAQPALACNDPIQPSALVMVAPRRATSTVLGRLAPLFLEGERTLHVVDGANSFDPYAFSREARRRGLRDDVLDRVFVTRCFTIHQLAAVTRQMLPPLLGRGGEPAITVLGLDHLFLEETLRATERALVLRGVMGDLGMLRGGGARLLVTHEPPPRPQALWRPLLEFGDMRARMLPREDGDWRLQIERCDHGTDPSHIQHLASGGDRLLEGVPPGTAG